MNIADYVVDWSNSPFTHFDAPAWLATTHAIKLITVAIDSLSNDYAISDSIAIHQSAFVEDGARIKGPAIIGPNAFVGAGALIRGGVFLDQNCTVGHACELKTSFMFSQAKIAHLSFVGDSIIGARVNIEAGAVVANYRNESRDKRIRILHNQCEIDTGVDKFGAWIGDDVKIGANAVIAPGAILVPGAVVPRLASVDQHPGMRCD
ncbi:MAG: DapH/DapD/GlmU-related protein [Granulosicoccus sp.]